MKSAINELEKDKKQFILTWVQPGLAGLMDGSVSTLAPNICNCFCNHEFSYNTACWSCSFK